MLYLVCNMLELRAYQKITSITQFKSRLFVILQKMPCKSVDNIPCSTSFCQFEPCDEKLAGE